MSAEVILGDCLEVMRTLEAASVDAIVTDPLSQGGAHRLGSIDSHVDFPYDQEHHTERSKGGRLASVIRGNPPLRGMDGAIGIEAGVGVPVGTMNLQYAPVVKVEINAGEKAAGDVVAEAELATVANAHAVKLDRHDVLDLRHNGDSALAHGRPLIVGRDGSSMGISELAEIRGPDLRSCCEAVPNTLSRVPHSHDHLPSPRPERDAPPKQTLADGLVGNAMCCRYLPDCRSSQVVRANGFWYLRASGLVRRIGAASATETTGSGMLTVGPGDSLPTAGARNGDERHK